MLVLLSDLHLTDETTACNIHSSAFELLAEEIAVAAARSKAMEAHIVLLGDIYDLVRTSYWLEIDPAERPWNGKLDPDTAMNRNAAVVEGHYRRVLDAVLSMPASNALRDTIARCGRLDVPCRVSYVIGNHDRMLHNYPSLRDRIIQAVPGMTPGSFVTSVSLPEYGLLARHGHEWDEICHGWKFHNKVLRPDKPLGQFDPRVYHVQALGEPITAELMSGIVWRIGRHPGAAKLYDAIIDVNNVRPMTDAFLWLEWFGREHLSHENRQIVFDAFRESVEALLDTELAKRWDEMERELWVFRGDITDRLSQLLGYMKGKSFEDMEKLAGLLRKFSDLFGSSKDENVEGARTEWRNGIPKETQFVAYGHTHEARHDYFTARDNGTVDMYINTGTYLPLIQRTHDNQAFAKAHQMTLARIYRDDEDGTGRVGPGPTLDLWNGVRRKVYARG